MTRLRIIAISLFSARFSAAWRWALSRETVQDIYFARRIIVRQDMEGIYSLRYALEPRWTCGIILKACFDEGEYLLCDLRDSKHKGEVTFHPNIYEAVGYFKEGGEHDDQ